MATDHKSHVTAVPARVRSGAAQEDEVYGMLGALLGTLEVVATDDALPLAPVQAERVHSAVRLCHGLQHQIEALLALAGEHLGATLRCADISARALVEHAVRSAVRGFDAQGLQLRMLPDDAWEHQRVYVDCSRVDRMLKALAETLAGSLGRNGVLEVSLRRVGRHVALVLTGQRGSEPFHLPLGQSTLLGAQLLIRGATKLFEMHGGGLVVDAEQLHVQLLLPASEEP